MHALAFFLRRRCPLHLLGVAAVLSFGMRTAPAHDRVAIRDVTVVDVEHRRRLSPRTVFVEDGVIRAVGRDVAVPPDARAIDGRGRFLIPGLVDAHVHLFNLFSGRAPNEWTLPLFVANGVTAVREMNSNRESLALVARWERERTAGERIAPRVLAAGVAVGARDAADAERQVEAAWRAGAGFVKVFSETTPTAWRWIAAAARGRGLPVAGHAPAGTLLLQSTADGLATNEHLMQAFEACAQDGDDLVAARPVDDGGAMVERRDAQEPLILAHYAAPRCRTVARRLGAARAIQVPTLVLPWSESRPAAGFAADPRWPLLRDDEQARWHRVLDAPRESIALARLRWKVACSIAADFHAARVPMLAGTDAPMPRVYPGFSLHDELARFVECGFTPWEALQAATQAPAAAFRVADGGTVAERRRADLVLLDADPTRDIGATRRIRAVLVGGRAYERAALDAMLQRDAGASPHADAPARRGR